MSAKSNKNNRLPFQNRANKDFQYIEELSTAYWYSEVLFAALEMDIFTYIQTNQSVSELADILQAQENNLYRFLKTLESFELIKQEHGKWYNCNIASCYLVSDSPKSMRDFFLYRRYLQDNWMNLARKISARQLPKSLCYEDDYDRRTMYYVKAMDKIVCEKSKQIKDIVSLYEWNFPILDVGGGAGSLGYTLIKSKQGCFSQIPCSILFDLPEVIKAAKTIYNNDETRWQTIKTESGDFRTFEFEQGFGLIIMSNFLHVYSPNEAKEFIFKAASLLKTNGLILIHDYFPDRKTGSPHKGFLYDINMMLNTFNGECHTSLLISNWLDEAMFKKVKIYDLNSDSSIIIGR